MRKLIIFGILTLYGVWAIGQSSCYQLVWSDEFNGNSLNRNVWNVEVNDQGGGNNELQYYTDRTENLRVEGGNLVIEARKENYLTRNYTSARITTQKKVSFRYGRIEARMKLPYGKGIWPAFWMLGESISQVGWPNCGEIDIMEMIGGGTNDSKVHCTLHWGPMVNGGHPYYGLSYTLPSGKFADDYHIFAVEWDDKAIRGFCDNTQYFVMDITKAGLEAFHNPFFIILNLAVGGNWPGNPDATTVFPQKMYVDYVRVYKKTSQLGIEGKNEVQENENNLVFKIRGYTDSLTYQWNVPSSVTILSQGADSLKVKWGCNSDTIRLKVKGKCDSTIYTFPVKIKSPKISGKKWVGDGMQGLIYRVDSLPGATFKWQANGVTLMSDSIFSWVKVNALQEGSIKVNVTSVCNVYTDSFAIKFGDGQFPFPNASKPATIPGTIVAANFDTGGEGVAYHDIDAGNKGNVYRLDENVDIEAYDNSYTIGWFDNGEWVEYTVNVAKTATYKAIIRVASQLTTGSFSIYIDGQLIAEKVKVPSTGGWSTFANLTVTGLALTEGTHVLRILSYGGFNLGKMTFIESTETQKISQNSIRLYPNPASKIAWIELPSESIPAYGKIFSIDGTLKEVVRISTAREKLDLSRLAAGYYYLSVEISGNKTTLPFVVR
ncbi:MAG: family 16 glycosylhydrolase [Bacteroidales bacterium]|nr:family 16 glycosylhydrolase [Bacteroidales bacterium]